MDEWAIFIEFLIFLDILQLQSVVWEESKQ